MSDIHFRASDGSNSTPVSAAAPLPVVQTGTPTNPTGAATSANQDTANGLLARATSTSRIVSAAASTNGTSAKASAGTLFYAFGYNAAATPRYLKVYNKASAPTVGTDTPVLTFYLPPTSAFAYDLPRGQAFATGIAYALTTGSADNDTGALTAADVLALNVGYA